MHTNNFTRKRTNDKKKAVMNTTSSGGGADTGENKPRHFNWRRVSSVIQTDGGGGVDTSTSELDNDDQTLANEKTFFETAFASINGALRVDHIEKNEIDGEPDAFVLTATSLKYLNEIRNLCSLKSLRYTVTEGVYPTKIDGRSMRPLTNTACITRIPLKKSKRTTFLFTLISLSYLLFMALSSSLFYRIVIAK